MTSREVRCRIVYYGPMGAGKTTCLKRFNHLNPKRPGAPQSFRPLSERTTRLDFIAPDVPPSNGTSTRLFLSTVSSWAFASVDRRVLLQDVEGIVFVADSRRGRRAANLESMAELIEHLRADEPQDRIRYERRSAP